MRLCSLVNHGTYQLVLGKFIRSRNRIEPVGIGVIRLITRLGRLRSLSS